MKRLKLADSCSISKMMEDWLLTYKARNTVKQTTNHYRFTILKLIGLVGDIPVSKLNASVVDQFKIHLRHE
ncbi:MAG: hypothetical protein SCM11_12725 [Bacillota bacterium]|nr:hypothetical protein [Bacillota bacterium]